MAASSRLPIATEEMADTKEKARRVVGLGSNAIESSTVSIGVLCCQYLLFRYSVLPSRSSYDRCFGYLLFRAIVVPHDHVSDRRQSGELYQEEKLPLSFLCVTVRRNTLIMCGRCVVQYSSSLLSPLCPKFISLTVAMIDAKPTTWHGMSRGTADV
jgi:hypothetical protein